MGIHLIVNGADYDVDVEPDAPLLWVIREELGLTGTKYGCGVAACGACTVHVNGKAMRSCSVPVSSVGGALITTIEGLAANRSLSPVQQAWIDHQIPQCGYCQSGMIMAVSAFLATNPHPTDEQLAATVTNICRCGTYSRIRAAVHSLSAGKPAGAP
ncbi:MAG TPA: (2Fe-2S)-binding protein [Candidatus Acidoferrum sp.]|nr:(2Fe-2S)-binding protein [Candidatus Acidoferrum sp.]